MGGEYHLRLVVRVRGKKPIGGIEEAKSIVVSGIEVAVRLKPPILSFVAEGFSSEEEALAYLPNLKIGLWSISIAYDIPFKPEFNRLPIYPYDDPKRAAINLFPRKAGVDEEFHGAVQGEGYFIYRTGERIASITTGDVSLESTIAWENASKSFEDGLRISNASQIDDDENLRVALELFTSSLYEVTIRARFVTLISCLEVLAPELDRHSRVVECFDRFEADLRSTIDRESDPVIIASLKAALSDAQWKRRASIGERIRQLIGQAAAATGKNVDEEVRRIKDIYSVRSRILHKGSVVESELNQAYSYLRITAKQILLLRLGLYG